MSTATLPDLSALTGTWTIDPSHSSLEFAVKHAMVTTVRGRFADFSGTITLDGVAPDRSTATVDVQIASVDTRNEQRDAHLRSPDFFDADQFPTMTFRSTGARVRSEGEYVLTGDLTIKGVSRSVELTISHTGSAVDAYGNERVGFEGTTTINRKDWGLSWNVALEAGGLLVAEKVTITLDVSATRQA
jgi:polyisoprenoid-binding protein YceI